MSDHAVVLFPVVPGLRELGGFPDGSDSNGSYNAGDMGSIPGSGKIPCRREWQPTPGFLPGEFHVCACALYVCAMCSGVCVCEHVGVYVLLCVMAI